MNFPTKQLQNCLFCLCLSFHLWGQAPMPLSPDAEKLSLGIYLGMAFSNINADRIAFPYNRLNLARLERQPNASARPGLFFLLHLNKTTGIETGMSYEKSGLKAKGFYDSLTMTINTFGKSSTTFSYEYLTVPILFKKQFNETSKFPIIMHIGPYFGFLQTAAYGYTSNSLYFNPDGSVGENSIEFSSSLKEQTRKVDFGLRLQVGVERKISDLATVFACGFHSRGLSRIDDFPTNKPGELSDGRHRAYGIYIGGFFRMK